MQAFLQGMQGGNQFLNSLMNRQQVQANMQRQAELLPYQEKLMQSQANLAGSSAAKNRFSMDPEAQRNFIMQLLKGGAGGLPGSDQNNIVNRALAKKFLGVDINAPTPDQKLQNEILKETTVNQAKLNQKELGDINKDLPVLMETTDRLKELIDITKRNPDFFGHYLPFGEEIQRLKSTNPEFGKADTIVGKILGDFARQLSPRSSVAALNLAKQYKINFKQNPEVALGKMTQLLNELQSMANRQVQRRQELLPSSSLPGTQKTGGNVTATIQHEGKIYDKINGRWHERTR